MNIRVEKERVDCSRCAGTGEIYYRDQQGNRKSKKCSRCKGAGVIYIDKIGNGGK